MFLAGPALSKFIDISGTDTLQMIAIRSIPIPTWYLISNNKRIIKNIFKLSFLIFPLFVLSLNCQQYLISYALEFLIVSWIHQFLIAVYFLLAVLY